MVRGNVLPSLAVVSTKAGVGSTSSSNSAASSGNNVPASLIAGSSAGLLTTLTLYPMEVVRVRMQVSECPKQSPFSTVRQVIRQGGGFRALYTGIEMPLVAQMCYKATVFTVNSLAQRTLLDSKQHKNRPTPLNASTTTLAAAPSPSLTLADRFLCGALAGMVNAAVFVTPVEHVRNQLIVAAKQQETTNFPRGVLCVLQNAHANNGGLHTLWRGLSWTVVRDTLGMGCFFATLHITNQGLQHWNEHYGPRTNLTMSPFWTTVVSGGLAGLSFWMVALPVDTAKTWIQTSTDHVCVQSVLSEIYGQHGLTGVAQRLFRGWQVAFGRSVPSAAITFSSYSLLYQYWDQVL